MSDPCNPMDCSLPGSSDHGILQARILQWVAISFSRGSSPTQGSNLSLLRCKQTLNLLSHQGSGTGLPGKSQIFWMHGIVSVEKGYEQDICITPKSPMALLRSILSPYSHLTPKTPKL